MNMKLTRIKPNELLKDSYGRYFFWKEDKYIYFYIQDDKVINCLTNEVIFDKLSSLIYSKIILYKLPLIKADVQIPTSLDGIFTAYSYSKVDSYVIDIFFSKDLSLRCYQGNNITKFDFINTCIDNYYSLCSQLEENSDEILATLHSINYTLLIN